MSSKATAPTAFANISQTNQIGILPVEENLNSTVFPLKPSLGLVFSMFSPVATASATEPVCFNGKLSKRQSGALISVAGTPFGDNTSGQYTDQIQYRAWGAVKQLNYKTGDNALVKMQYDNRLRVSRHEVDSAVAAGGYVSNADAPEWQCNLPWEHFSVPTACESLPSTNFKGLKCLSSTGNIF